MDIVIGFVGEVSVITFGATAVENQIVTFLERCGLWVATASLTFLAALFSLIFCHFYDLVEVMALIFVSLLRTIKFY